MIYYKQPAKSHYGGRGAQMKTKTVFWDFDGTLTAPNEAFTHSLGNALRRFGYEVPWTALQRCVNTIIPWHTSDTAYPRESTSDGFWEKRREMLGHTLALFGVKPEEVPQIAALYRRLVPRYPYEVFPETKEVLARSAELGFSNCVLSNNFPELEDTLSALGLAPYFNRVIISSLVGYDKPRPELFRFALRETGFPDTAVMVGDNYAADILGAKAVGMKAVWIAGTVPSEDCAADFTVHSLAEVPRALERII